MAAWARPRILAAVVAAAVLPCASVTDARATPPIEPPPPMLSTAVMAEMGWTLIQCSDQANGHGCIYRGSDGLIASVVMQPTPIDSVASTLEDAVQWECPAGARHDVGRRLDTIACSLERAADWAMTVAFGNDSWYFVVSARPSQEPGPEDLARLLALRDRQLDAAGGEREGAAALEPLAPSDLDVLLPQVLSDGWLPPEGLTSELDSLAGVSAEETPVDAGTWEYLGRRSTTRAGAWTRGEYGVVVIVSEYPYEVLAGLALGVLGRSPYARFETPPTELSNDLVVVDARTAASSQTPVVVAAFRRGRYEFQIVVNGPDLATSVALAWAVAPLVVAIAPTSGPTHPVWPPSTLATLVRAVLVTAALVVSVLLLRRLLSGRARRSPPLEEPHPVVADVSAAAARLRRNGRALGAVQLVACAVIVVALVADIGWWSLVVVAAGLAIGLSATALARRREQGRSVRAWSLASRPAWLFGAAGAALVVVGVALAVRALSESVLVPSITHLRLAERLSTTPERISGVMAAAGIGLLVLGAFLLRRSRAHAHAARARVRSGRGDAILYLRSFDDDRLTVPSVHSARRPFFELFGLRGRDPFEEGIAWELAGLGTLTAVGQPGRSPASLGTSRDLLSDDGWQESVVQRMDTSRAVVVSVGTTAGLAWELGALSARGHLGKCVLVVPPATPEEVCARWAATRAVIDEARERPFVEPVSVVGTLVVGIDGSTGRVSAVRADRVDDAAYRAAIAHAIQGAVGSPVRPPNAAAEPWPAPQPGTQAGRGPSDVVQQGHVSRSPP